MVKIDLENPFLARPKSVKIGRSYWQAQSKAPTILKQKNTWVKQRNDRNAKDYKAFRNYLQTEGARALNKEVKDYLTTSNDNTWTSANRNPKNPHLQARATKGAKSHALWEKEHPVLNTWGNVLGAAPFAVAAAPLAAAAGSGIGALADAAAATAIGQGVTNFLAPIAGTSIAGASIPQWLDLGLTSAFGANGIQTAINEGGISPTTALEIAPLGRLARPMWDVGKQGLQYTIKGADNAARYASPSYDLYRTIGETPVSKGSFQRSLTEDFGIFAGPKRVTIFDTPYRQTLDDSFNLIKESTKAPKQYGMRFSGKHGNVPEVLGEDGKWHSVVKYYKNKRFSDPIDNSIIVGKESKYQPTNYLFHYDTGNYPIHYNADGSPILHRLPNRNGDLGPIWWSENAKWGDKSVVEPRLIKAPDYGAYRQSLADANIGDSDAILTGDYPLKDAEFLERDNLLGTMRRGIFAQQPTVKAVNIPTAKWRINSKTPSKIISENASSITPEQWTAAQDAAIAKGDMAEAQRLRDLHFMTKAPNTFASINGKPLQLYHGTNNDFNAFDLSKYGSTDGGTFGRGVYTTPIQEYAQLYGKNNMPLYMKLDNPRDYRDYSIGDLIAEKLAFGEDFSTGNGIDGVIGRPSWKGFKGLKEYVSHNPKNIKSSNAVTYDDKGIRIPLGKRDNFKLDDIRYGLLPFGVGLTGYGLFNKNR